MRKINLIVIALMAVVIGLSSCTKRVKDPDKIGLQVFEILKNFDSLGRMEYGKNFITFEEFHAIGSNKSLKIEEEVRNNISSLTKEDWKEKEDEVSENYREIFELGDDNDITWSNIEYMDFSYNLRNEPLKTVEGLLIFWHRTEEYKIETTSVWNGNEYLLVDIELY